MRNIIHNCSVAQSKNIQNSADVLVSNISYFYITHCQFNKYLTFKSLLDRVRSTKLEHFPNSWQTSSNWLKLASKCFSFKKFPRNGGKTFSLFPSSKSSSSSNIVFKISGTWSKSYAIQCLLANCGYLCKLILTYVYSCEIN